MGTTEVPEDPGKIISFFPSFTDVFSALGRPVDVEYRTDFYGEPARGRTAIPERPSPTR